MDHQEYMARNVGIDRRSLQGNDRRRRRRRDMTPAELAEDDELRERIRMSKRKIKREMLEKAAAILVALSWSSFLTHIIPSTAQSLQIVLAAAVYIMVWCLICGVAGFFGQTAFEQVVLLVAELTAFTWRDATKIMLTLILAAAGQSSLDEKGESPHEEEERVVVKWWYAWAGVLLVCGIVFIATAKRLRHLLRSSPCSEATQERTSEGMIDVDKDVWGLAVGWTLQAATNLFVIGPEWEALTEEAEIGDFLSYFWMTLASILVVSIILGMLAKLGVGQEGSLFSMVIVASGYFCGFTLNIFFCNLLGVVKTFQKPLFGHVTLGRIIYPLIMLSLGACVVAKKQTALDTPRDGRRNDGCLGLCNPLQRKLYKQITILAYQTCVALAFEELLDLVVDAVPEKIAMDESISKLLLAVIMTGLWAALCVSMPYLLRDDGPGDDANDSDDGEQIAGMRAAAELRAQ